MKRESADEPSSTQDDVPAANGSGKEPSWQPDGQNTALPSIALIVAPAVIIGAVMLILFAMPRRPMASASTAAPTSSSAAGPTSGSLTYGSATIEASTAQPSYKVVFNFVDRAPTASWIFNTPSRFIKTFEEASKYTDDYPLGQVRFRKDVKLEGGERFPKALETRPPTAPLAEIWGEYDLSRVSLKAGDYFFAKVGFPNGAYQGDVIFEIRFWSGDPEAPMQTVASYPVRYNRADGALNKSKSWRVALPSNLDTKRRFYLEVNSNTTALQDRAMWFEAQIRRPVP